MRDERNQKTCYAPAPIPTSESGLQSSLECQKLSGYKIYLPIPAAISEHPIKAKIRSEISDRPTKSVTLTLVGHYLLPEEMWYGVLLSLLCLRGHMLDNSMI